MNLLYRYLKNTWHDSAQANNQVFASIMEQTQSAKVLDIGCDDGSILISRVNGIIERPKLWGIDTEIVKIRMARKKGITASLVDAEGGLPFGSNFFDIVTANQIIEHIVKVDFFISEIKRVLKPGGYLIAATENLSSWHNIFALLLGWQAFSQHVSTKKNIGNPLKILKYENYDSKHIQIFTPYGLKELLKLHGLVVETTFGAGYYPFRSAISKFLSRIDPTHAAFIGIKARKPKK